MAKTWRMNIIIKNGKLKKQQGQLISYFINQKDVVIIDQKLHNQNQLKIQFYYSSFSTLLGYEVPESIKHTF